MKHSGLGGDIQALAFIMSVKSDDFEPELWRNGSAPSQVWDGGWRLECFQLCSELCSLKSIGKFADQSTVNIASRSVAKCWGSRKAKSWHSFCRTSNKQSTGGRTGVIVSLNQVRFSN